MTGCLYWNWTSLKRQFSLVRKPIPHVGFHNLSGMEPDLTEAHTHTQTTTQKKGLTGGKKVWTNSVFFSPHKAQIPIFLMLHQLSIQHNPVSALPF